VLPTTHGTDSIIYSAVDNKFVTVSSGDLDNTNVIATDSIITSYRFRTAVALVSAATADKKSGDIFEITTTVSKLTLTADITTSTAAYADYSDELSNFVRVGSDGVYWYHVPSTGSAITATIPIA